MDPLSVTAPAFVEMAHRIVWATVATVGPSGQPRSRVLHPIWEWDGVGLTGWVATFPTSPKATDLAHESRVSITYWSPDQDTCTADCDTAWETSDDARRAAWERFANGPEPVGYDPALIPGWTSATTPEFGVLRLEPSRLRVFPGTMLLHGTGDVLNWHA